MNYSRYHLIYYFCTSEPSLCDANSYTRPFWGPESDSGPFFRPLQNSPKICSPASTSSYCNFAQGAADFAIDIDFAPMKSYSSSVVNFYKEKFVLYWAHRILGNSSRQGLQQMRVYCTVHSGRNRRDWRSRARTLTQAYWCCYETALVLSSFAETDREPCQPDTCAAGSCSSFDSSFIVNYFDMSL